MTQAIVTDTTNALNMLKNLKDALSETDKGTDFGAIFDKTLNTNRLGNVKAEAVKTEPAKNGKIKAEILKADVSESETVKAEPVKTESVKSETVNTIGGIKEAVDKAASDKLDEFKEVLSEASEEANLESSLDLTLSRDISEIIAAVNAGASAVLNGDSDDSALGEGEDESEDKVDTNLAFAVSAVLFDGSVVQETAQAITDNSEGIDNLSCDIMQEGCAEEVYEAVIPEEASETDNVAGKEEITLDDEMLKELNIEMVEAETDTQSDESFDRRQSPEEYALKIMLNQNLTVKAEVPTATVSAVANTVKNISEQILRQMDSLHSGSKVNIVLNPESLGKVSLQIINTKEGLSAQFTVATNEAREIIMKGLDGLRNTLTAQGIGVDSISVKIEETEESSYNPDWTEQEGSRGGNKGDGQPQREEKEKGLFEKTIAKTFKDKNIDV